MSYRDLLKQRPSDITAPKPIPAGPYLAEIKNYEFGKFGKNDTECVNFHCVILQPGDEIDPQALDNAKDEIRRAKPIVRKYLTEDSLFMLKQFLVDVLKIEELDSLEEMLDQAPGKQLVLNYVNGISKKDGKREISYVDGEMPA